MDRRERAKYEEPEYRHIMAWDKLAQTCHQYLRKGRKVYVEGRLHTRVYTDKDGVKREVTEIVLEELVILDKMPDDVKEKWILRMRQMALRYRSKSPATNSSIKKEAATQDGGLSSVEGYYLLAVAGGPH